MLPTLTLGRPSLPDPRRFFPAIPLDSRIRCTACSLRNGAAVLSHASDSRLALSPQRRRWMAMYGLQRVGEARLERGRVLRQKMRAATLPSRLGVHQSQTEHSGTTTTRGKVPNRAETRTGYGVLEDSEKRARRTGRHLQGRTSIYDVVKTSPAKSAEPASQTLTSHSRSDIPNSGASRRPPRQTPWPAMVWMTTSSECGTGWPKIDKRTPSPRIGPTGHLRRLQGRDHAPTTHLRQDSTSEDEDLDWRAHWATRFRTRLGLGSAKLGATMEKDDHPPTTTIEARVRAGKCDGRTPRSMPTANLRRRPDREYASKSTITTTYLWVRRRRERWKWGACAKCSLKAHTSWTCRQRRREHAQHPKDGHDHRPATTTSVDVLRRGLRIDDNGHLSSLSSLEKPPHSVSSLRISKGVPAFRRRRIPAIDVDVVVADKSKWTWVSCSKCLALKVKSVTSMGKKEI
ncbi:hypothetical protein D9611_012098 [Ephemerocybe angulata]|uniref:Uncharacterized protein n=1 Tax=Ephemerocybe angulata TaxID=980116 RepID=A0A8H5ES45_9AGAR|nr:hypothetical protein D9611_012098 [Tulosesus angulatus]